MNRTSEGTSSRAGPPGKIAVEGTPSDNRIGAGGLHTTYQQAIIEIYDSLYQFQRQRTPPQESAVVDCISKWYELNAVFENPFTRASGIAAIVNQFSLMSLLPGQIWSELGDICESEDYNGNRVVVFSHTLHFDLLGTSTETAPGGVHTPYYQSVPATPHVGTPSMAGRFPSFHAAVVSRMAKPTGTTATSRAGGPTQETMWPLRWLLSALSPRTVAGRLARYDLRLSTRLQFNEQARIVSHEDSWGIKELVEFLAPSLVSQLYSCSRWLVGWAADSLSRTYLRSSSPPPTTAISPPDDLASLSLHAPILIGSNPANLLHIHLKPPSTENSLPHPSARFPSDRNSHLAPGIRPAHADHDDEDDDDDDDDELNTEAGSADDPSPPSNHPS